MRSLLARHPGESKRAAVEHAIEAYLAKDATEAVRSLAGGVPVRGRLGGVAQARPARVSVLPDTSIWSTDLRSGTSGPAGAGGRPLGP